MIQSDFFPNCIFVNRAKSRNNSFAIRKAHTKEGSANLYTFLLQLKFLVSKTLSYLKVVREEIVVFE